MSAERNPADVVATIPRSRVPVGAVHCQAEKFPLRGTTTTYVVRELTAAEFADWQMACENSGAGAMHQQIDFVGRCLCDAENLANVGEEFAGQLPRTVMQQAAEIALRVNGLAGGGEVEKKA